MSSLALVRDAEPVSAPTINVDVKSPTAPIHGLGAKPTEVDYEMTGADGAPVIAVLGGISASKHVTSSPTDLRDGWWQTVVGAERAIDTIMQTRPRYTAVVLNKVDFAKNKYYYSRYYGHQYKNYYAEATL